MRRKRGKQITKIIEIHLIYIKNRSGKRDKSKIPEEMDTEVEEEYSSEAEDSEEDVMGKVKFKSENNNDKSNTQKKNKNGDVEKYKSNGNSFAPTQKHKKCYFCVSGTHMLNNLEIKDKIERYQLFYRKENVQSHHQQAKDKRYEKTVDSDIEVSVSSKKKSGWIGLQISLYERK